MGVVVARPACADVNSLASGVYRRGLLCAESFASAVILRTRCCDLDHVVSVVFRLTKRCSGHRVLRR